MTRFEASVTREGKWWMVSIPSIDGLTQARRLGKATEMAREYIAASQDLPLDEIAVDLTFAPIGGVGDITARVARIAAERRRMAELERDVVTESGVLAEQLAAADVPLRDIGAILGVSHQRAHQLTTTN
ncbi:hypothetical protein L2X99_13310 [Microbacterium sp. KUDC0406]|uniref:hypothetical protein n=1 Tax=Microbacterium sp. KUDC0406 TaxID=2909588 RepID=UPI001F329855|nr:hypothetical protein [Microbacterium sp. KUDC0406]UJP09399.1 hypothetical protein L2X99_13310 [Microbacterium sp. KUDC0406]